MKEIWKDIKNYEGLYQISNLGNVKKLRFINNRCNFKKESIKKLNIRNGYYIVQLSKNGKRKSYQVHRLVAEAFIENPENKSIINHIDYNPLNNNVDNLEWCTQKENVEWSKCHMYGRKNITHSNTGEKYICYRKSADRYRIIIDKKEYPSCKTLEEAIKVRDKILKEVI